MRSVTTQLRLAVAPFALAVLAIVAKPDVIATARAGGVGATVILKQPALVTVRDVYGRYAAGLEDLQTGSTLGPLFEGGLKHLDGQAKSP